MNYLFAFVIGGLLCVIGQLLIDDTKLTPARILVGYVVAGVILGAFGVYPALVELAGAGATVPLCGFGNLLATAGIPDPGLMIRTSGEQRISNYMLWQCAYTEFYYTPVLWPDFRKNDLEEAILSYNRRERRYGKVD